MNRASKIDEWWAANPGKRQQAAAVVLVLWLGGLAVGLVAVGVDDATSIKHDFLFLTDYSSPATLTPYHFKISNTQYQHYKAMNHDVDAQPGWYAGFCDSSDLYPIAKAIKDSCGAFASDEMILQALLSFVQDKSIPNSVQYMSDPVGIEYPKYPLETLGDGGGDCEDLAILFASLAEILGYETVLVLTQTHVFAAVHTMLSPLQAGNNIKRLTYEGLVYYPCECTGYGMRVGEMWVPAGDTIEGALDVNIIDPVGITAVAWVLPISAGAVVVVIIIVAKKKQRGIVHNVVTP